MPSFSRRKFLARGAGLGAFLIGGDILAPVSTTVSVGVAGLGTEGRSHLRALSQLAGARVTTLCDPDPRALEAGSRIVSGRALLFADFNRLLDRSDIDLIAISGAPADRMRMIEAAAQAGKHIVVAHPGPLSLEDSARLHAFPARYPVSVRQFPSDPGWDVEAFLPLLALKNPSRVEIQVLGERAASASETDEFEIAARLLSAGLPHRAVALTAGPTAFWNLSAEVECGPRLITLHQSRSAAPPEVERSVTLTIHNGRSSAAVTIDSWREESSSEPSLAAWSRAVAAVAGGNPETWAATTRHTAVAAVTVHMVAHACRHGEFTWRQSVA